MRIKDRITRNLPVNLIDEDEMTHPLEAAVGYDPADPYAVSFAFHAGDGQTVTWTVARDLARDGLDGLVGEGDVQLWPSGPEGESGRQYLYLSLSSPLGSALFRMRRRDVVSFLLGTTSVVPFGSETDHVDVDGELAALTDGPGVCGDREARPRGSRDDR